MAQHQTPATPFTPRRFLRLLELVSPLHRFKRIVGDASALQRQQEADIEALAVGLGLLNPVDEGRPQRRPEMSGRAGR